MQTPTVLPHSASGYATCLVWVFEKAAWEPLLQARRLVVQIRCLLPWASIFPLSGPSRNGQRCPKGCRRHLTQRYRKTAPGARTGRMIAEIWLSVNATTG